MISHMTMFEKIIFLTPCASPAAPKAHPLDMTQASEQNIPFDMFYIFHL